MLFLTLLSQKTYAGEFVGPEVILSRSYLRKESIWQGRPPIINLSLFKNAINSDRLGVRLISSAFSYLYDTYHW